MDYIFSLLGIFAIAAVIYFLFKQVMYVILVLLLIVGTYLAVEDLNAGETFLSVILQYGIIVGIVAIPGRLVTELNELKEKVKELENRHEVIIQTK
jgi:hypothetical protein